MLTMALEHPEQRIVSAADAPRVGRSGSPFAMAAANQRTSEPEEQPEGGVIRPRPRSQEEVTRARGAQFKVACVLLSAEDGLEHHGIAEKLDGVKDRQLSNALSNMRTAGRVEKVRGTQRWRLTDKGREWATGGANLMNQRAAGNQADATEKQPRKTRAVATVPASQLVPVRPSFRCYIASDGTFGIEKGGQKLELALEETRQMLRYLDAVGEQLVAGAEGAA
jgi:hypothetical protein